MSASPQDPSDSHFVFRLPRKSLRIVGIAAGVGFLLFLLVWWLGRDEGFYTVEPTAKAGDAGIEALPAPLPGDGDGASGLEEPRQPKAAEEAPAVVETASAPAPIEEAPPAPPPAAPAPAADVALAPGDVPAPIPGQNPSPQYPTAAMRRGDTGTVMLRVTVGTDGVPSDVEIVGRSGSRDLDRAAIDAMRRWRFRPAQRDGQPVSASVDIPITFDLQR